MVTWRVFAGSDAEWDAALAALPGANAFQSSAWARHKADSGWRPARALADGAAAQALSKDLPGGGRLLWARGGPVGEPALWTPALRETLAAAAGGSFTYGRVCSYREADDASDRALRAAGWQRPATPLDRNMTYLLDLTPEPDALLAGLSTNWRHNLKRGQARAEASPWSEPDPVEMEKVYKAMEALKGLPPQHRAGELGSMARALGGSFLLRRAVVDGRTVALRACAVFGTSAVDLLAAATEEARKVYASYACLWSLVLESRRLGAKTYDLGGADPAAAPGVADFKKGLGARLVTTLGEWDFASPPVLRRPAGALIALKLGKSA
ncbi:MAG: peptidoglycan bridge formation glycyltransferase FemA/FemB family protein [Elusimicrobia bacterium]|nr:peptidoglycan bridge formation glycyltransferase FemA/FemB family protein [Elusimicrobiota bacterium]